jgi:hypothetical protein
MLETPALEAPVTVHAYAAHSQGKRLEPHTFDFGALGANEIDSPASGPSVIQLHGQGPFQVIVGPPT